MPITTRNGSLGPVDGKKDFEAGGDAYSVSDSSSEERQVALQIQAESEHAIKYRSCSWQKVRRHRYFLSAANHCRPQGYFSPSTYASRSCPSRGAWLIYSVVTGVATDARTHRSYSVLGLVPGVILTLAVAGTVQYTSLILWRYCMKHPEVRDVCDIGRMLFGGSQLAYNLTAVIFLLNNTFIQGASFSACAFHS
jgi:hypothetical protein